MQEFWKALPEKCIHIASDGSHHPDTYYGAGVAVMVNEQTVDDDNNIILAGAKLISALLILHIMFLRYGTPPILSTVKVWIDNAEVLSRIKTTESDDICLKSYSVRYFSDMKLLRNLHSILSHTIQV